MILSAGTPIPPTRLPPITREQLRDYAEASGDPNPIHLDDAAAKASGLPGIIAHGMLIAGMIAERAERFMAREAEGGGAFALRNFQTRFRGMTFLGDVVSIGGQVKRAGPDEVILELQAANQKGEKLTTGTARFARGVN